MAKRIDFNLTASDYAELGRRALEQNDAERAVGYFKSACELSDDSAYYTELGFVYSKIHALDLSNAVLYKAMSKAECEEDENSALWILCSNALEAGDAEVASYYLRYLGEDDSAVMQAAQDKGAPQFRVARKAEQEFYENKIFLAEEALADNDFDTALKCVEGMEDAPEPFRSMARKITTLSLFAKGDFDRVTAVTEDMVRDNPTMENKATLATAYSVQEREADADRLLDEIFEEERKSGADLSLDIILRVLPILISRERDEDVLRLTRIICKNTHLKLYGEMYESEALYNLGKVKEAERIMGRLNNIFGKACAAWYYLEQYRNGVPRVDYGHELPHSEKVAMLKLVRTVLENEDVSVMQNALAADEKFNDALKWVLYETPDYAVCPTLVRLTRLRSKHVETLFRDRLIGLNLSFDAMTVMLDYLLGNGLRVDVNIVSQNRYKPVEFALPAPIYVLPTHLRNAVFRAACDIVYTDEDPNTYLGRLSAIVTGIATVDKEGALVWRTRNSRRISMLRSEETMVGVLLSEVYFDDPDPDEDAMDRYGLNERTFRKYKKIFFGDDDEN